MRKIFSVSRTDKKDDGSRNFACNEKDYLLHNQHLYSKKKFKNTIQVKSKNNLIGPQWYIPSTRLGLRCVRVGTFHIVGIKLKDS